MLEFFRGIFRYIFGQRNPAGQNTEQNTDDTTTRHEQETGISKYIEEIQNLQVKLQEQDQLLREEKAKRDSAAQQNAKKIAELESEVALLKRVAVQLPPPTIVSTPDSISVVEVGNLVQKLNAQIEQVSNLIADSLTAQGPPTTGNEPEIPWDELNGCIGSWLCNELKRWSKEHTVERDPLIVQITLQTGLVNACSRIINDLNPPVWIDGMVFSRAYNNINKADGQATADAWKALTQTHMTISQRERQEANKRYLMELLLKLIIAVGGSLGRGEILLSQYRKRLEDMAQRAVGLHKAVSEDVTSMKLATYTTPSDALFDPSQMEDTEGNESETRTDRVVCTVEMGLRCRKGDGSGKNNGAGEKWGVTLRSKVVLPSTLVEPEA